MNNLFIREYLREFSIKFKTAPMEYLGAWGTLIHDKNLKSKISCQTPFKAGLVNKDTTNKRIYNLYSQVAILNKTSATGRPTGKTQTHLILPASPQFWLDPKLKGIGIHIHNLSTNFLKKV
jgi:hypothetical protein